MMMMRKKSKAEFKIQRYDIWNQFQIFEMCWKKENRLKLINTLQHFVLFFEEYNWIEMETTFSISLMKTHSLLTYKTDSSKFNWYDTFICQLIPLCLFTEKNTDTEKVLREATQRIHAKYEFFETTLQIEVYDDEMELCNDCTNPE
jgi:hypothetical protein